MPMRKQQTTRIAIVSTSPALSGSAITAMPFVIWMTNTTAKPIRKMASRMVAHRSRPRRTSDSSAAATNSSPVAATATDVAAIFCPGISANSDTASALVNAVRAATARMRWT